MTQTWKSHKPRRWKSLAYGHRHGFRLLTSPNRKFLLLLAATWSLFSGLAHMVYGLLGLLMVIMLVIAMIPFLYLQEKWQKYRSLMCLAIAAYD